MGVCGGVRSLGANRLGVLAVVFNAVVARLGALGLGRPRPRGVVVGSLKFMVFGRNLLTVSHQVRPTTCCYHNGASTVEQMYGFMHPSE